MDRYKHAADLVTFHEAILLHLPALDKQAAARESNAAPIQCIIQANYLHILVNEAQHETSR
jgi:hypothetical protein